MMAKEAWNAEQEYLKNNPGKHKANFLTECKANFIEIISVNGESTEQMFDMTNAVEFNDKDIINIENENLSFIKSPDAKQLYNDVYELSIAFTDREETEIWHVRQIKNVDYIKDNAITYFLHIMVNNQPTFLTMIIGYIDDTGKWVGNMLKSSHISGSGQPHKIDDGLMMALPQILESESSIVDFGCGNADYIKTLLTSGFKCEAYDGNPNTPIMTGGIGKVLDLTHKFDLGKTFDYVISLEVAEHIPKEYEEIYIDNLIRHTDSYLIISWAVKGQGGDGHVNEQDEEYVLNLFKKKNMIYNKEVSDAFRNVATLGWFKETIFVFGVR